MTDRLPPVSAIRAGRLIVDPGAGAVRRDVEIVVDSSRITAIEELDDGAGGTDWVIPTLADAHDHGRGLPTLSYGALDDALELWIPALSLQPRIDAGLLTRLALAKLARSGVGAVVHCHNPQDPDRPLDEARAVAAAARDVGVRLAYVVPLSDRNRLGYGDAEAILDRVEEPHRGRLRSLVATPPLSARRQVDLVEEIAEAVEGPGVSVQYGPVGPQWASDALLEAVARSSAETGRRVHIHLFETRLQREWAAANHPDGLLVHLDRLGLLSPRLTVAHGVWLDDDELALLAERGVIVSVNTSSNLRLRSGTAPVERMRAAKTSFAFGMDGMSLDDDEDALRELRLGQLIHAGTGLEQGLTGAEALGRATSIGHTAVDGSADHGSIGVGSPADLVVLDGAALAIDVADGACDELTLLMARATARHVRRVVVGGRLIVDDGVVLGVDEAAAADEVAAACRSSASALAEIRPLVAAHQAALAEHYRAGGHATPQVRLGSPA